MNPISNLIAFTLLVMAVEEFVRSNFLSAGALFVGAAWVALSPSNGRPPTPRF